MTDVLPIRLGKLAHTVYEEGFDVDWNDLSDEDREQWMRVGMALYQQGVADALKDPGSA